MFLPKRPPPCFCRNVFCRNVFCRNVRNSFQTLNYGSGTYHSVNKALNASYHSIIAKIKELIANRDKDQLLYISFDEYISFLSSQDNKKFTGACLYVQNENVCLGLLNYTGFCGGEEIGRLLVKRLEIFGLTPSDISIANCAKA